MILINSLENLRGIPEFTSGGSVKFVFYPHWRSQGFILQNLITNMTVTRFYFI